MRELEIVKNTDKPNTVKSIYNDLVRLGIEKGDIVLVHSSLSRLGWVCGGSQAVIEALLKVVGEDGTLVMPAHSGDLSDPKKWVNPAVPKEWIDIIYENMPAFNKDTTPTRGMGKIAENFRTYKEVVRSNHPQVSFAAKGPLADKILDNHILTPQLGEGSPLGKLYDLNAKILLLGVGYENCTSFHLAETKIDKMPEMKTATCLMENGERAFRFFYDVAYDSDDFDLIGEEFEVRYDVSKGKVGNGECRLFNIREAVDFAKDWIERNRVD